MRRADTAARAGEQPPSTLRELRRAQVIAEARRIIAEDGLDALTIGALESRLSFSRGVITYHFENKDEIVLAVLADVTVSIGLATRERVRERRGGAERIAAVLEGMTRGFLGNPESVRILVSFWGRLHADARARELNAGLFEGFRKETLRLLQEEARAGSIAAKHANEELAALVVGTVLGVVSQAYFATSAIDVDAALTEAAALFAARIAATTSDKPPRRPRAKALRKRR